MFLLNSGVNLALFGLDLALFEVPLTRKKIVRPKLKNEQFQRFSVFLFSLFCPFFL